MKCHIVPQVYQKKWNTGTANGENVFYFDKNLNLLKPNGGNVKSHMQIEDYYILSLNEISDIGDSALSPNMVEDYFSSTIENNWNTVYELFEAGSSKILTPLKKFFKEYQASSPADPSITGVRRGDLTGVEKEIGALEDFLILQLYRRYENMENHIEKLFDSIPKPSGLTKDNEAAIKRMMWLKFLADCAKSGTNVLSETRKILLDKYSILVAFADSTKFILSDNPVIFNNLKLNEYIAHGLFIAISPDTMIMFCDLSEWCKTNPHVKKDDIIAVHGTDDAVKQFNNILLKNSFKEVGFFNKDIDSHIDSNVDKNSFYKMLGIN